MREIKSFLYLDEYKMYSMSSQIFGGLTEYLIDYQGTTKEEEERQRGPLGSGKVIADILKSESRTQERKYLHDYSYTLFESGLKDNEMVLSVSPENIDETIKRINNVGFVAVKGKAVFNDMNVIRSTITKFNELGEALAYVTNFAEIEDARQQLETSSSTVKDRNTKAKLKQSLKALTIPEDIAKSQGLRQDPTLLAKLDLILEYGFQDQFEVQMAINGYTFSAILKREYLREQEHLLVRKYSRFSEKEFVLLGTIAQSPSTFFEAGSDKDEEGVDNAGPQNVKEAIMVLVESLFEMESSMSGKLVNEVIIDPIALYRQIRVWCPNHSSDELFKEMARDAATSEFL